MSQPILLDIGITGLAFLATVGLLLLARRRRPMVSTDAQVRFLGMYSPVLSWLRDRSRPAKAIAAATSAGPAAETRILGDPDESKTSTGGPASAGLASLAEGPSIWDWLMAWPGAIRHWARHDLHLRSIRADVAALPAAGTLSPTPQAAPDNHAPIEANSTAEPPVTGEDSVAMPPAQPPLEQLPPPPPTTSESASVSAVPSLIPDPASQPEINVVTRSADGANVRIVLEIPIGTTVQITVDTSGQISETAENEGPAAIVQSVHLAALGPIEAASVAIPVVAPQTERQIVEFVPTAPAAGAAPLEIMAAPARRAAAQLNEWRNRLAQRGKTLPLVSVVFALALVIYLITRLWGIDRFPLFFYSDEAAYVIFANQLVEDGFHGPDGQLVPLYFEVDTHRWAPEIDIYFQLITSELFGNSIFIARATNALISVLCVVAVGLILKRIFNARYWWTAILILGIIPAYFLYSRVAFEMIVMVSFYAAFLLFYLLYRTRSAGYLYLTLVMGAAAFYSYSAAQPMMLLTGALLLLSDFRYHVSNWRTGLKAAPLALLLVVPAARFSLAHPGGIQEHLHSIASYWVADTPLTTKIGIFAHDYAYALSPQYWFLPNPLEDSVLPNQHIPGQANFGLGWLPLVLLGLWICLRHVREPRYRALLLAALAVPMASVLDSVEIRRLLAMLVPLSLFVGLGLEWVLVQIQAHFRQFTFQRMTLGLFALLAVANFWLLGDALINLPRQYPDYTLEGVQFGVKQIFQDTLPKYLAADKAVRILVSPVWANNTQKFPAFFYSAIDQQRVNMGVIYDYLREKGDLTDTIMVMTADEYGAARISPELKALPVVETLYYPNGQPSFYVTRPVYADNIDALMAEQKAERAKPVQTQLLFEGQLVTVTYSVLGSGEIGAVFDGSTDSLVRGLEANPFILGLSFPQPRAIHGIVLTTGSLDDFTVTAKLTPPGGQPVTIQQNYRGLPADPTVDLAFPNAPPLVSDFRLEIMNNLSGDVAQIHVRELALH